MGFFNELWADRLQYWTVWFEVVGFSLTFIEVLFPNFADRIEELIDNVQKRIGNFLEKRQFKTKFMFPIMVLVFLVSGSLFFWAWWPKFWNSSKNIFELVFWGLLLLVMTYIYAFTIAIFSISFLLILGFIALYFLDSCIKYLNRLSNGKALGSIGLIFAFLGLLGELYQYITMVNH